MFDQNLVYSMVEKKTNSDECGRRIANIANVMDVPVNAKEASIKLTQIWDAWSQTCQCIAILFQQLLLGGDPRHCCCKEINEGTES